MKARPLLALAALAAVGAGVFATLGPRATSAVAPAALGALVTLAALLVLLRELRPRDRLSIAAGAAALGLLVGSVAGVGPEPAALAYAAAFLPAAVLLLLGFGRERLAFELARLERDVDDPAARPAALARAAAIRDEARSAARALDPEARGEPAHAGDPRAVYAYAAEVLADAHAQGGAHAAAVEALTEVPARWMPTEMRPLMIGNLAFCCLATRAPEAALAALDRLPEADAAPAHRAVLRAARAAALAHLGRADEALAIVGRTDDDSLPPDRLKPRYAIVRALALLAAGDRAAARASLEAAVALPDGRAELRRFRPAVPEDAAPLVDELLG